MHERLRLLLIRPQGNDPSPLDQAQGVRLAALHGPAREFAGLEEDSFERGNLDDLERKLHRWAGKVGGVVGATSVPEAIRLGQLAESLSVICFVANNNPSVWQGRRHIFHIGLPSRQTAVAVAHALQGAGFRRVFLLHDETEFQSRVATAMVTALKESDIQVISTSGSERSWPDEMHRWRPELFYLIYSDEKRALPIVRLVRSAAADTLLLLGRSLLRSSFIAALGGAAEGVLFVDLFRRNQQESTRVVEFTRALFQERVDYPTANHGFGWDAMMLCCVALANGVGHSAHAIEYLESGVLLEGVTGQFRFDRENHNGREGLGPTRISRWRNGRIEEVGRV
jgi:ABC-type branched-subunit amino acid transport system substrate-binding protein